MPLFAPSAAVDVIRDLDRDPVLVGLVAAHLGVAHAPIGTAFRCVLHEDAHPSAALFRMNDGCVLYHDFHRSAQSREWLTLGEVYAAQISGHPRKLNPPEHLTWRLRLAVDAQLVAPAPVSMPPLPAGASYATCKVYAGLALLFGCKWLHAPGEPSAASWRFLADWCGIAQKTAGDGLQDNVRRRTIIVTGDYRTSYGKTMATYLPGSTR